jgi:hypothetical protein
MDWTRKVNPVTAFEVMINLSFVSVHREVQSGVMAEHFTTAPRREQRQSRGKILIIPNP